MRHEPVIVQCDGCGQFLARQFNERRCRMWNIAVIGRHQATMFKSHSAANRSMRDGRPKWHYDGVRRETEDGVVFGTDLCPRCDDVEDESE